MKKESKIKYRVLAFISVFSIFFLGYSKKNTIVFELEDIYNIPVEIEQPIDSPEIKLKYPYTKSKDPAKPKTSKVGLKEPLNIKRKIRYNPTTGKYEFTTTIGDNIPYGNTTIMSLEEYRKYQQQKAKEEYWKSKIGEENKVNTGGFAPKLERRNREFGDICNGKLIDIKPQGSAELKFGLNTTRTDNPAIPVKQRQLTTFDFDQQIQINVQGSICDKFKLNFNYNTEATFDFENQTKLAYEGNEDQIIQKIEAGNISFPIQNSLIQGSQSLFGIRADLKFGKLNISSVVSQNKGERKEINIKNGAQQQEYEIEINNYEANKHFFVNHYHRDNYDNAMATVPNVSSQVRITKMEVWVTNRINDVEDTRNVIAFSDMGETRVLEGNPTVTVSSNSVPYNQANNLYSYLTSSGGLRDLTSAPSILQARTSSPGPFRQSKNFEKLENARLLSSSEYSYNSLLGYISLNQPLNNDEILGVAYQYTFQGKTYQVGEFSTDGIKGAKALFLKLIKGTINSPKNKAWDLMMKNVYSLGAYQISQENFKLDVWYNNPKNGVEINYIPQTGVDKQTVVQVIGSDVINKQGQDIKDGVFDFIPFNYNGNKIENGGTINPQTGRVIFSRVEPFGSYLENQLLAAGISPSVVKTIAYTQLYDSTKTIALQSPELNRFKIKGTYESENGSEIALNAFNIPQGSVTVTAGGVKLIENQDYTVDYNIGRVKILNEGILNSGTPIKISLESNSLFTSVQKTLIGTHFDYKFNKNFNLGATFMRLSEKPLSQKINIGNEPVKNIMLGLNGSFQSDAPFLTKLVDKIPLINTKEKSSITASVEAAYLIPGHNKAIGDEGQSFIDDFEGSQSSIDVRSFNTWVLASVPQGQPDLFPEASSNSLDYGKNRALTNWNVYDPSVFYEDRGLVPNYIDEDAIQNDNTMRLVQESELFPNRSIDQTAGQIDRIAMFNLAYFPSERGPYNYDTDPNAISKGLSPTTGLLNDPQTRWGGIMRQLQTNDFESSNIEYIQFWVMEPFNSSGGGDNDDSPNSSGGELYFNLGNVSEDILKDGVKTFENGLPTDGVFDPSNLRTTSWGRVPTIQQIVRAFDNNTATRVFQDVGLDGLSNSDEASFYSSFVSWVNSSSLPANIKTQLINDPSADDYTFYRNDKYDASGSDILERYKRFNGLEGNSATDEQSQNINAEGYPTSKTTLPDAEDINRDNTLSETESYYQYKIDIKPGQMEVGKNFIVDKVVRESSSGKQVTWYQYRIPIRQPSKIVNGIQDFRSIRFMRMFMKGFSEPVILRFARLELLRGTWRRFNEDITEDGDIIQSDPSGQIFNISAVNIEENSARSPINYVLPPNFQREINPNSANQAYLNEQSLELEVCGLEDGAAKAAFRSIDFDVLNYKKIKMFIHGEQHTSSEEVVNDDDVTVFIRIGTDFKYNYYEYEMPIKMTQWKALSDNEIWPEANNMEIVLEDLKNLKVARNNSLGSSGSSVLAVFEQISPSNSNHVIKVKGNPNLRGLKTIMIGIRNPKKNKNNPWKPDDGKEKCVKIWVNELRMADFENSGGWAAKSRVQANLADFATVSLAGHISTPGFGGIEDRVSERQRETIKQVDATTNVQLGKFFNKNAGVQIPLYLGFSQGIIDPKFDPLNPDIEFENSLKDVSVEEQQERIKAARDLTVRRSLNLTNVRIAPVKSSKLAFPWDIKNFSFTYAYTSLYKRDVQTDYNTTRTYHGGLNYAYQTKIKPFSPFRNNKTLRKSNWFKIIRDININPLPKQFSFNSNIDRTYSETKARDITGNALIIPQFSKTFTWDRIYSTNWQIMQGLSLNYNATNQALILEPGELKVDKTLYPDEYEVVKDSVLRSISNFGENKHFLQSTNLNYTWPFKKIPILSFVNLTTKYQGTYDWQRAPLGRDSLGNTVQNSRNISWNGSFNMSSLYNKVPYFRKVLQRERNASRNKGPKFKGRNETKKSRDRKGEKKEEEDKKKKEKFSFTDGLAKILMSLQNISINYNTIDGQILPGYIPNTELVGLSNGFSSPGYKFVFGGEQERDFFGRTTNNDFALKAATKDWLVKGPSRFINAQHTTNHSKNFNGRATFEPFKGIRIELNSTYNYSENLTENFLWGADSLTGEFNYQHLNTLRTGTNSYSFSSIRTAFSKVNEDGTSEVFNTLLKNRYKASEMLNSENQDYTSLVTDSAGFYDGYGGSQQEVLLSSFISAYSGKELTSKTFNPLSVLPNLNWRVTLDIFNKIPAIKKIFKNVVISHAYNSTFTVASFNTDLQAVTDNNGKESARDVANNIRPEKQILAASITEQFNPLIRINATWQNSLITNFELRSSRNISLSLTNNQVTELKSTEITIGTGYRFQNVKFPIKIGKKKPISDIDAKIDISYRNNKNIRRLIDLNQTQVTGGQRYISIKASAQYVLNKQFTLRFYYDRVMTDPFILTSFPTMNQNVGFAIRVNLFQ